MMTFCEVISICHTSTVKVFYYKKTTASTLTQGSQVIAKVWSVIRGGATQRGGVTQIGGARLRGGVTQIFAAPKILLAVQFDLLFIIDQHK